MKTKILFVALAISTLLLSCEKKSANPNYTKWGIKEAGNTREISDYFSNKAVTEIVNRNEKTWLFSVAPCDTCETLPTQCWRPMVFFITKITDEGYYTLATTGHFFNIELNTSGEAFISQVDKIFKINENHEFQTHLTLPAETDTEQTYITNYKIDSQNNFWIGTNKGLFRWNNEKLQHYHTGNTIMHDNHINKVEIDANGKVWILTNEVMAGFYTLENEKWSYIALENVKNSYNSAQISNFFIDKNSNVWTLLQCSNNCTIIKFDGSEWQECNMNFSDNNSSNQLIADSKGRIWMIKRLHAEQIQDRTEKLFFYENNQWNEVDITGIEKSILSVDVKDNKILLGLSQGFATIDYTF